MTSPSTAHRTITPASPAASAAKVMDPQVRTFLDQLTAQGLPDFPDLGVEQARELVAALVDLQGAAAEMVEVRDLQVPGADGHPVPVRVYRPTTAVAAPVLMYFHSGAFVLGNLDFADKPARHLAQVTGCAVVSVDYRLAPEHRAPAAVEDCFAATRWAAANAPLFGSNGGLVALYGDSCGGGLVASVALLARDRGGPALGAQVLAYPVTDLRYPALAEADPYPSRVENVEGLLLTRRTMAWAVELYLARHEDAADPVLSPVLADLTGLPSALVITAGWDVLRDEGAALAERMAAAGVTVEYLPNPTMIHGFLGLGGVVDHAGVVFDHIGAFVRTHLGGAA